MTTLLTYLKQHISILAGIIAAIAYGAVAYFIFDEEYSGSILLSVGFFVFTPPILGFLTVLLASTEEKSSWTFTIFAPWLSCLICIFLAGLFSLEAWFCILLALPLFLILASGGGLLARLVWEIIKTSKGSRMSVVVLILIVPYVIGAIEHEFTVREEVRRVHSQIEIEAPTEVVWQNITNLQPISLSEQPFSFFHLMGLPRPLEAQMACESVGCIRRGYWENGLAFEGKITQIKRGTLYWVRLEADTRHVKSSMAPLDQIGGRYFDMVDDGYEIEPVNESRSILHLYSTYRVRTGINAYAATWLDFLLRDIQGHILKIEKRRSEN